MLILDKPRNFGGSTIRIPLYHRSHLSLFPTATVWLCLLPGRQAGELLPEITISPIELDAWSDLWRISITMKDRVGLVHDFFQMLADNHINIVAAESSSMETQRMHSIEAVVDAKRYQGSSQDKTHAERSLDAEIDDLVDLRRFILARALPEIALSPSGKPRLKIRRVRHLFEAKQSLAQAEQDARLLNAFRPIVERVDVRRITEKIGEREVTRGVVIDLPVDVSLMLSDALGTVNESGKPAKYLSVSNTADRFLRVYFIKQSENIIDPTLRHEDKVGALAAITDAMARNGFNILTALSRQYKVGSPAHSEFVLKPPPNLRTSSEEEIRAKLKEALSTPRLINDYKIGVGYPKSYSESAPTEAITRPVSGDEQSNPPADTDSLIRQKYLVLKERVNQADVSGEDKLRYRIARDLWADTAADSVSHETETAIKRFLFVSYSFAARDVFDRVKEAAKDFGFEVITAAKLSAHKTTRVGVVRTMREQCTHFLGLWTEHGGIEVEKNLWWPSPWLGWEYGVANTTPLHSKLFISERIREDSWNRFAGEATHVIYSTVNFNEKLAEVLDGLSQLKGDASVG
jgi:predicted amino acid-binding ACT domain protein